MLSLEQSLPPGALIDPADMPLTEFIAGLGAQWFSFDSALAGFEDDVLAGLEARTGTNRARPTEANTGHARLIARGRGEVLTTTPRVNCGFVATERIAGDTMGLACVFASPGGAAQTLTCIDASKGDSGLVLCEEAGMLTLTDRRNSATAQVPLTGAPGAMQVAFAHIAPGGVSLSLGDGAPVHAAMEGSFRAGPCDLYLACRRGRNGLLNTLGALHLADVILFPDRDPTASDAADLRARLRRYTREVFDHGV